MKYNVGRCDEYIYLLNRRLQMLDDETKGAGILKDLLQTTEHWLPSELLNQGVNYLWNSNRAEGFFDCFKSKFGFRLFTA